jgi:aspartate/methionine/tyrosine aminotransferase
MPRHPDISSAAAAMPSSIFARLVEKLAGHRGEIFPFHLGDTYLGPPDGAHLIDEPESYTYHPPAGHPALIEAVAEKLSRQNGLAAGPANVQITCGATQALGAAMRTVADPGDEVILLAPYWPLIRGQVIAVGARPVEVPFTSRLYDDPGLDVRALVREYVSPRTAAIYVTTPNNPDGKVVPKAALAAVADVASEAGLWILSDEVYEDYVFEGAHASIGAMLPERTLTAFSFSKSYAQAGLRVGYLHGPETVIATVRKLVNHAVYSVPRATQRAALAALRSGAGYLAATREEIRGARDVAFEALARLGIAPHRPEGASYVFVDLSRFGDHSLGVLERLAEVGVLLAPGDAFGRSFAPWARFCYTAVPRGRLIAGLARLSDMLVG